MRIRIGYVIRVMLKYRGYIVSHRSAGGGPSPRFRLSASRLAVDMVWFGFAIGGLASNVGFSCYYLFFASDDQYGNVFGYDDRRRRRRRRRRRV
jgi:hypothetical protein